MANLRRKFFYFKTVVEPEGESFSNMLRKVGQLETQQRAYQHLGQEVLFETENRDGLVCGKITLLREEGLPTIGAHGTMTTRPLDLRDEEGLQEASHFAFMPEKSLLVFEYNHFGPRIGLFFNVVNELYRQYFSDDNQPPTADWLYIQRGDALDRVAHSRGVKAIDISYVDGHLNADGDDGLNHTVHELGAIDGVKTLNLSLKGEKGSREPIMTSHQFLRHILPRREHSLPSFDKLRVKIINQTGSIEVVDFLEGKVVSDISVVKLGRSRELDSADLFEKVIADMRSRADGLVQNRS